MAFHYRAKGLNREKAGEYLQIFGRRYPVENTVALCGGEHRNFRWRHKPHLVYGWKLWVISLLQLAPRYRYFEEQLNGVKGIADEFAGKEESFYGYLQSCFLLELSLKTGFSGLTEFDPAPRRGPELARKQTPVIHHQELAVAPANTADPNPECVSVNLVYARAHRVTFLYLRTIKEVF